MNFKLGEPILVHKEIANYTAVIIFEGEEIILTKINIKEFNHKVIHYPELESWSIYYYIDDNYFSEKLTRYVLFEKTHKIYCWFYYQYNFYESIEVIGKGSEVNGYEKLFAELKTFEPETTTFEPETTLILRRSK